MIGSKFTITFLYVLLQIIIRKKQSDHLCIKLLSLTNLRKTSEQIKLFKTKFIIQNLGNFLFRLW